MVDGSSDSVGIGVAAPASKLHVSGGNVRFQYDQNDWSEFALYNEDLGTGAHLQITARMKDAGNNAIIPTKIAMGKSDNTSGQADGFTAIYSMTNNVLAETMRVVSGNVGIGTTAPSQLLHIKGAVPTLLFEDSTNGNLAFIGDAADFLTSGDTDADAFGIRSEGEIRLGTGGNNTRMLINSSGNVGINKASSTDAKLSVYNNTANDYCLELEQDQAATALFINQDANAPAIKIDTEATGQHGIIFDTPEIESGSCILINDCDSLTTGSAMQVQCASANLNTGASGIVMVNYTAASTNTNTLLSIKNDNPTAANTTCLFIDQDSDEYGLKIDMDGGDSCIKSASAANHYNIQVESEHASYASTMVHLKATGRTGNNAFQFLKTISSDDDVQHILYGNGDSEADGTWSGGGADYAEYFESKDGKSIAVGTTVKLDGDKIIACEDGDTPIGAVRPHGNSVVIGNSEPLKWQGKYLKDDYGDYAMEEYTVTEWESPDIDYKDGDSIPAGKKIGDRKKDGEKHSYQTDKIPSVDDEGDVLVVPDDATISVNEISGSGKLMRKKPNPDYDKSKEYTPRKDRGEWCLIGLLGQIPITKGQPVSSNWIKMKDVSDTVEMYFVK